MQIILIRNARKGSSQLALRPGGLCLLLVLLVVASGGLFYSGYHFATQRTAQILYSIRNQTTSTWEDELSDQQATLNRIQARTEQSLEALAGRLSMLQGHVMRLDALGSRLASMANLNDIQFGVDNPPGMGGPVPASEEEPPDISDLMKSLDQLQAKLNDRSEKLSVMETMLINRTLQEQTLPGGRPIKGGWVSSLFGYRTDPITGKREFHEGMDFAGKMGTPVMAVAAGIITWAGPRYGYGNLVEISHGKGYVTHYAHNSKILVKVGEKVEKGEVIALMGSTGRSTGPHVHFEVLRYGRHLDPRKFLSQK
ncbi:MAG: M23 family metallopeptidase [Gammaproteobacteria bacterium]|jgi:murein DD-endopeptidase MepM/ murein hydrolase activator NlpD